MKRILLFLTIAAFTAVICTTSCVHRPQVTVVPADGNFPDSIAKIFLTKCTNSGCHNQASYVNAGDLLLDSWEHLFQGGLSGAVVVAYNTAYSPLLYYCNTDSTLGVKVNDPGHFGSTTPPTLAEYKTLSNWIAKGAPDKNGNVPFATNAATRQKIYLTISGCNLIAVIDGKSKQVMRYIPVGVYPGNQSLHDIEVSSDGNYAYVSFYNGTIMQKIDTRTDTVVGNVNLANEAPAGQGGWSILYLSPLDTSIMLSGFYCNYAVATNTSAMTINHNLSLDGNNIAAGQSPLTYPHGITSNASFDTFFITLQDGNTIQKVHFKGGGKFWTKSISLNGNPAGIDSSATSPNPHQVQMAPDYSKYFVTCQNTNEVRVMDAHTDKLIATIPVGAWPQEMAISTSRHYLFAVCMEDATTTFPGAHGSVYVIDYDSLKVVKVLYGDFYQPHDIAVDEQDGLLYICSTNYSLNGPPPHHVTACSGRPGWYTVYDLNTLQMDNKRYEVSVFPYTLANRF